MRYWKFGIFDGEYGAFKAQFVDGRSILSYENDTVNQDNGNGNYNPEYDTIGWSTGDSEPTHNIALVEVATAQIKAKLGQIPNLIKAALSMVPNNVSDFTVTLRVYDMFTTWQFGDCSTRYRDISALLTWYEDTYGPYGGQDRSEIGDELFIDTVTLGAKERAYMTLTDKLMRSLRDNDDMRVMLWFKGGSSSVQSYWWKPSSNISDRPAMEFWYFYPVEFFKATAGGDLDLTSIVDDTPGNEYYIGAVGPGETSSPTKGYLRNVHTQTWNIEVFDDHPEWSVPMRMAGSGTAELVFVVLADNAVSQKYTLIFYSATQYEILAEAYYENSESLHPQIDADPDWRGSISTDFVATDGGLQIPAEAFELDGYVVADEIEVTVRGNTTDESWPYDSNDQVEITKDSGGNPVTADWRPVCGIRTHSTADVDIDATTKLIPVRRIDVGDFSVGTPCFIQNVDNIDEGTIKSLQDRALGSITFSGSGLDDLSHSGNYKGGVDRVYRIQIDATGSPDTFSWSRDGSTSWVATGVAITGSAQLLEDDVWLTFAATTGHTATDYWLFDADTWAIEVENLTSGSHSYASGAIVGTTLPFRAVEQSVYSTMSADSGASQSVPSRIYLEDTSAFSEGDVLLVQRVGTATLEEEATIASGGVHSDYVDLTAALTNDYYEGDYVTVIDDTGARAFWMRVVAEPTTNLEAKRFRLNARLS